MITQTKAPELDELGKKLLYGINKALRKLVETAAANNESLVIGDLDGGSKLVPAKELLKNFPEENV
jgi:hypothetical protein